MAATENPIILIPHFPDEILIEIFIKLPITSLLLFKSVSKHWLNLIQNPNFINLHFNRPVTSTNEPILVLRAIKSEKIVLTMLSDDQNDLNYQDNLPLEFMSPCMVYENIDLDVKLSLLGPCNGLFCVTDNIEVVVFNPSTRKCRKVWPSDEMSLDRDSIGCFECVGFGYDDIEKDYKVVRFFEEECGELDDDGELSLKQIDHHVVGINDDENDHDIDHNYDEIDHDVDHNDVHDDSDDEDDDSNYDHDDSDEDNDYDIGNDFEGCDHGLHFKIEIYSLSTNTWREIRRVVPAGNISSTHSYDIFLNGAFHWLHACAILVFDLNKEAFKWFKLPDSYVKWLKSFDSYRTGYEDDDDFDTYLSVLNETLALTVHRKVDYWKNMYVGFEIWVMKEYGIHRSWIKQHNISPDVGIRRPLSFSKKGELLAEKKDRKKGLIPRMDSSKSELVSFNLETREVKTFNLHGVPGLMHAFRYRESLVSLK